jgi:hypothetical protein
MLDYDPTPSDKVHPEPFLKLPFKEKDARHSLVPDNGYQMAADEIPIAGSNDHKALDFVFAKTKDYGYGLPIVAAAAGRAYYTYQYITGEWTDPKTGKVHLLGYGAGLVVEVRHQDANGQPSGWVTQYIHLSEVSAGIPYLVPQPVGQHDWNPVGLIQSNEQLWNQGVPVAAGQQIGLQGDTGIGDNWWDNFDPNTGKVTPRDRQKYKPWDPPQLHFQLYQGRVDGVKQNIIDPLDVYGRAYPEFNPYGTPGNICFGPQSVFMASDGKLLYAA